MAGDTVTDPLQRRIATVLATHTLCPGSHEIEFERGDFEFRAGEEIVVHNVVPGEDRVYSLSGGERDATLRFLFREIPEGRVSPRLAQLRPGDRIEFSGPQGSFVVRDPARPMWFIATGTGIAPLLSFLRSNPALRPVVLHGVRERTELYARAEIEPRAASYHACVTRDPVLPSRRVTDALAALPVDIAADHYLCGGNAMIQDVSALLLRRGVPAARILSEPYYFW